MPILAGGLAVVLLAAAPATALPHPADLSSSAAAVQQLGDAAHGRASAASSVHGGASIGHGPIGTAKPLRRSPGSPAATSDAASFATADRKPRTDNGGLKEEKAILLEGLDGGPSAA